MRGGDASYGVSDPKDRLAAALADRYRIERELGQGGMATVYLAEDLKHDRKVAIKVLKPELAAVLGAERFVQEIKTTAALSHPHILPLFDSGEAGGFLYYVMPFIEGETIRDKLNRETQFGVDEAVKIATEVADALDYAHRHGVIHRDIKPENILLHDGRPMVMDFGIALAVSAAAGGRMTETGLSLGTPHYMSPEQATAEKEITARSDVYSLASVLYEMLAGVPPHEGGSAQQTIMRIITETPKPVQELRRSVPRNVAAALAKALEKLPADRFESAKDFSAALANPSFGADALPDGRRPAAPGGRFALGPPAVAFIAAAALLVGVAGTKLLWRTSPASGQTTRLMVELPVAEQPHYSSARPYPLFTQAQDGSGLYYWGPGTTTRAQLLYRSWDRLSARRLTITIDEGCCIALSPHGDSLAYLVGPHALEVEPVAGGIPRAVADSGVTSVPDFGGGVDWADDGSLYYSGLDGLIRVSPHGGEPQLVARLDTVRGDLRYLWPAVLPGSKAALVTITPAKDPFDPARAAIGVADFATGKVDVLTQGLRAIYAPTGHLIVAKPDGVLWAIPYDAGAHRVTGRGWELPDTASTYAQVIDMSLSRSGTLTYTKGVVGSYRPVWVDRTGQTRPVAGDLGGIDMTDPALSPDGRLARGDDRQPGREVRPLGTAAGWRFQVAHHVRRCDEQAGGMAPRHGRRLVRVGPRDAGRRRIPVPAKRGRIGNHQEARYRRCATGRWRRVVPRWEVARGAHG